jgi:putative YpdA family bacillithiol system oxidoreductase
METLYTFTIFFVLLGVLAVPYWIRVAKHRRESEEKLAKSIHAGILTPVTLHPHIDIQKCIGCGSCVKVCPESVLGLVNGRAAIISGLKCVGHALCEDVCPVGAITMGFGTPKEGQEIPWYDNHYQTNVEGLYIVGELGGIGLIKNAVAQATHALQQIVQNNVNDSLLDYDVVIVGAGPAGLTASLAAKENKLRYLDLEQGSIGGTILHYPRQKLILTAPVELPLYGKLKISEIAKEALLEIWTDAVEKYSLNIKENSKVDLLENIPHGFRVKSGDASYTAKNVVLALGRRGSPRKLGVPGEDLPNVAYQLIEAESYLSKKILVVGGGDSAVEAAVALARQKGNEVTISYRRSEFIRLKEKNEKHLHDLVHAKKIRVVFNSQLLEIHRDTVFIREEPDRQLTLPNDYVFIFAGGELPTELLKRAGVRLRTKEMEAEAMK